MAQKSFDDILNSARKQQGFVDNTDSQPDQSKSAPSIDQPQGKLSQLMQDAKSGVATFPASMASAGNQYELSKSITEANKPSAEYQALQEDDQRRAQNDSGPIDAAISSIGKFARHPLHSLASTAGELAPYIGMGMVPVVGEGAAIAAGAAASAGNTKQQIYERNYQESLAKGMSDAEAKSFAEKRASYTGDNADQIGLSAGIGAAAGKFGTQGAASNLAKNGFNRLTEDGVLSASLDSAKKIAAQTPWEAAGKTAALQAGLMGAQSGQDAYAQNEDMNKTGSTAKREDVLGAATSGAISGGAMGLGFGGHEWLHAPDQVKAIQTEQAFRALKDAQDAMPTKSVGMPTSEIQAAVAKREAENAAQARQDQVSQAVQDKADQGLTPTQVKIDGQVLDENAPQGSVAERALATEANDVAYNQGSRPDAHPDPVVAKQNELANKPYGQEHIDNGVYQSDTPEKQALNDKAYKQALKDGDAQKAIDLAPHVSKAIVPSDAEHFKAAVAGGNSELASKLSERLSPDTRGKELVSAVKTGDVNTVKALGELAPDQLYKGMVEASARGHQDILDHLASIDHTGDATELAVKHANAKHNIDIAESIKQAARDAGKPILEEVKARDASQKELDKKNNDVQSASDKLQSASDAVQKSAKTMQDAKDKAANEAKASADANQATTDNIVSLRADLKAKKDAYDAAVKAHEDAKTSKDPAAIKDTKDAIPDPKIHKVVESELAKAVKKQQSEKNAEANKKDPAIAQKAKTDAQAKHDKLVAAHEEAKKLHADAVMARDVHANKHANLLTEHSLANKKPSGEAEADPFAGNADTTHLVDSPRMSTSDSSVEEKQKTDSLKEKVRVAINSTLKGFGDKFVNLGHVKFILNKDATAEARAGNAKAYVDKNGHIVFIADRISPDISPRALFGIVLHEAGVHAGIADGNPHKLDKMIEDLTTLLERGDKAAHEAWDRIPDGTNHNVRMEEFLAYFAEKNPTSSIGMKFNMYIRIAARTLAKMIGLGKDNSFAKWANTVTHAELIKSFHEGLKSYIDSGASKSGDSTRLHGEQFKEAIHPDHRTTDDIKDEVKQGELEHLIDNVSRDSDITGIIDFLSRNKDWAGMDSKAHGETIASKAIKEGNDILIKFLAREHPEVMKEELLKIHGVSQDVKDTISSAIMFTRARDASIKSRAELENLLNNKNRIFKTGAELQRYKEQLIATERRATKERQIASAAHARSFIASNKLKVKDTYEPKQEQPRNGGPTRLSTVDEGFTEEEKRALRSIDSGNKKTEILDSIGYDALSGNNIDPNKLIKHLVDSGADINYKDPNHGASAIHFADEKTIKPLIDHGADVNAKDVTGETALHKTSDQAVAKALIDAGIDIRSKNKDGETPSQAQDRMAREAHFQSIIDEHIKIKNLIDERVRAIDEKAALEASVAKPVADPGEVAPPRRQQRLSTQDAPGEPIKTRFHAVMEKIKDFLRALQVMYQNKHAEIYKRVEMARAQLGGKLDPSSDFIHAIEASHGRTSESNAKLAMAQRQAKDFMNKNGISDERAYDTMLAQYVAHNDANTLFKSKDPAKEHVNATGMSNEDAAKIVASMTPEEKQVAQMMRTMIDDHIEMARSAWLISKEQYDAIKKQDHYFPLERERGSQGTGQGLSVTGKLSLDASPLKANAEKNALGLISMEASKTIGLAEKNRVDMVLGQFIMDHFKTDKTKSDWEAYMDFPKEETQIDPATGFFIEGSTEWVESGYMDSQVLDANGKAVDDPNYKGRDNMVVFKVDGQNRAIVFNDKNKAMKSIYENLKNMNDVQMGAVTTLIGKATRWLSAMNTQYNPAFGPFNFLRDAAFASLSAQKGILRGHGTEMLKEAMKSMPSIFKAEFARLHHGEILKGGVFDELQAAREKGIYVGYSHSTGSLEEHLKDLKKAVSENDGKVKNAWGTVKNTVESYNAMFENCIRYAAYKTAIKHGGSEGEAISAAKNITVNFNQKGTHSSFTGALYSFFNSNVQGIARTFQVLTERQPDGSIKFSKLGLQILGGAAMLGSSQAMMLAAAGYGPDEPDEETLQKNFCIPNFFGESGNKDYIKIPYPLGFHTFVSMGRIATQAAIYGDAPSRMGDVFSLAIDSYNPVGGGKSLLQAITPTIVDPITALSENKDNFGRQIYRENRDKLNPAPGYTLHKQGATDISIAAAKGLNDLTGGDSGKPGSLSPTPDQLDFLGSQIGAGPYRFLKSMYKSILGDSEGTHKATDVPVLGRLVGNEDDPNKHYNRFANNIQSLNGLEASIKTAAKDGRSAQDVIQENPEARLIPLSNQVQTEIKKLSHQKQMIIDKGGDQERVKAISDKINELHKNFNDKYTAAKGN